jgi:hypothetical protein
MAHIVKPAIPNDVKAALVLGDGKYYDSVVAPRLGNEELTERDLVLAALGIRDHKGRKIAMDLLGRKVEPSTMRQIVDSLKLEVRRDAQK